MSAMVAVCGRADAWAPPVRASGLCVPPEGVRAAARHAALLGERAANFTAEGGLAGRPGAESWLRDLGASDVPCAAVSRLPRAMLAGCLDALNLTEAFGDRLVCAEDGRGRGSQALLHAAVALERPPQCWNQSLVDSGPGISSNPSLYLAQIELVFHDS